MIESIAAIALICGGLTFLGGACIAVILFYITLVGFRWIMAGLIVFAILLMITLCVIYKILKDKDIFSENYLTQIRETKGGKYKEIFVLFIKNGIKIAVVFQLCVIIGCSIAFYVNPLETFTNEPYKNQTQSENYISKN